MYWGGGGAGLGVGGGSGLWLPGCLCAQVLAPCLRPSDLRIGTGSCCLRPTPQVQAVASPLEVSFEYRQLSTPYTNTKDSGRRALS